MPGSVPQPRSHQALARPRHLQPRQDRHPAHHGIFRVCAKVRSPYAQMPNTSMQEGGGEGERRGGGGCKAGGRGFVSSLVLVCVSPLSRCACSSEKFKKLLLGITVQPSYLGFKGRDDEGAIVAWHHAFRLAAALSVSVCLCVHHSPTHSPTLLLLIHVWLQLQSRCCLSTADSKPRKTTISGWQTARKHWIRCVFVFVFVHALWRWVCRCRQGFSVTTAKDTPFLSLIPSPHLTLLLCHAAFATSDPAALAAVQTRARRPLTPAPAAAPHRPLQGQAQGPQRTLPQGIREPRLHPGSASHVRCLHAYEHTHTRTHARARAQTTHRFVLACRVFRT